MSSSEPQTRILPAAEAVAPERTAARRDSRAEAPTKPQASPTPYPDACPRCGAPLRPEQEWCLTCGNAARTRVAGAPGWRTPVVIVATVLAVALAGLVVAFLAVSGDSRRVQTVGQTGAIATPTPAPTAAPGTTPAPGEPGAAPGATVPPATGVEQPASTPTPTPTETPAPTPTATVTATPSPGGSASGIGRWPSGERAYTVVLASATTRSGANRRARALAADGTAVGILDSDDFGTLRGGYFVVFSGQYDTRAQAEDALGGLSRKAAGAYVRRVTPRR